MEEKIIFKKILCPQCGALEGSENDWIRIVQHTNREGYDPEDDTLYPIKTVDIEHVETYHRSCGFTTNDEPRDFVVILRKDLSISDGSPIYVVTKVGAYWECYPDRLKQILDEKYPDICI